MVWQLCFCVENKTVEYILYASEINQMKLIWKSRQIKIYILEANKEIERILSLVWEQENALSALTLAFHTVLFEACFLEKWA